MKTKTTGIPFKDYNVNTTGALSLFPAPILSLTFSQRVIKPTQYKSRGRKDSSSLSFDRARTIVYDAFRQFRRKKSSFARFYEPARPNFYPITNFANRQKFPPGYTRDARDAPNRTRYPNRRELR